MLTFHTNSNEIVTIKVFFFWGHVELVTYLLCKCMMYLYLCFFSWDALATQSPLSLMIYEIYLIHFTFYLHFFYLLFQLRIDQTHYSFCQHLLLSIFIVCWLEIETEILRRYDRIKTANINKLPAVKTNLMLN